MDMQEAIRAVTEYRNLTRDEMTDVMRLVMTGQATGAQIGGFLIGLRMKGETVDEIAAAAGVMRGLATMVDVDTEHLVDTCGTGGDASGTFNVSTATAFVVAAAGGRVAKHGNRSVSSSSGSADLLEAAGANLELTAEQVGECIDKTGVGFLFAPVHHSAMKHAVGPRKEMGVRTLFNVLGPLTNPAGAPHQLLGVYAREWVRPLAEVLLQLGSNRVLVVNAEDGLDEISIAAPTSVAEVDEDTVTEYTIVPEDFGMERAPLDSIRVDSARASLALIREVFAGDASPASDLVALNAGAAIYAARLADSVAEGVEQARAILSSGAAEAKLQEFVDFTRQLGARA
ncbi:anthranilate phosphoribosyltransferase [Aquisalimonas lutea]|uniref:anthranilate phosphoribosyltransferase n=1 Tax=Aquisalimonas lutea TaxID=1327750 RepID=UPI0025B2E8A0|nr:anthranilate phosphoribosyltransferase [Aquisalimonas lutea]MDN3516141.1 anthranilate phosphoribosyltransferase [Aquisalimonas lutea]